ncbi:hypothetical protein [Ornithinimicrobium avium]|uniref:PRC-barrel domain-containing protein n=1 Tax=Ornithinimicrobium avium TaxID=2283195 RepID=A0A345NNF7_9MICO|nr:hypothetical protein [Ornithinimicrobium avium]AXH96565.1 hypothetical protein DV701_10920 [Ornithinimicrobium avium]
MRKDDLARPEGFLDAALQLLDRQLVDSEGRLAGKVDDVELTQDGGGLRVTGILVGVPAWLPRLGPRFGPWLLEWWRLLGVTRAHRTTPGRIGIERVAELDQEVRLDRERDGLVQLASGPEEDEDDVRHRLGDLLAVRVTSADGERLGQVLDVRMAPAGELASGRVRAVGLIVGRVGRPGSLMGYERDEDQGPAALAVLVRRIHRDTAYVPMEQVAQIDWDEREVRLGDRPG